MNRDQRPQEHAESYQNPYRLQVQHHRGQSGQGPPRHTEPLWWTAQGESKKNLGRNRHSLAITTRVVTELQPGSKYHQNKGRHCWLQEVQQDHTVPALHQWGKGGVHKIILSLLHQRLNMVAEHLESGEEGPAEAKKTKQNRLVIPHNCSKLLQEHNREHPLPELYCVVCRLHSGKQQGLGLGEQDSTEDWGSRDQASRTGLCLL